MKKGGTLPRSRAKTFPRMDRKQMISLSSGEEEETQEGVKTPLLDGGTERKKPPSSIRRAMT